MAHRVGITGGMGCGKSTVATEFARMGVPCFGADAAGARLYDDAAFLAEVRSLLGDGVFLPDGKADKRAVAARVFADPAALSALNHLVHPRVWAGFEAFCSQHEDAPYILFESAILYEYGFERMMDAVVCVYLGLEERLERLALRDGGTREALLARIAHQLPAEEVMMRADYVVLNYEGNPRRRQVECIDRALCIKFQKSRIKC